MNPHLNRHISETMGKLTGKGVDLHVEPTEEFILARNLALIESLGLALDMSDDKRLVASKPVTGDVVGELLQTCPSVLQLQFETFGEDERQFRISVNMRARSHLIKQMETARLAKGDPNEIRALRQLRAFGLKEAGIGGNTQRTQQSYPADILDAYERPLQGTALLRDLQPSRLQDHSAGVSGPEQFFYDVSAKGLQRAEIRNGMMENTVTNGR